MIIIMIIDVIIKIIQLCKICTSYLKWNFRNEKHNIYCKLPQHYLYREEIFLWSRSFIDMLSFFCFTAAILESCIDSLGFGAAYHWNGTRYTVRWKVFDRCWKFVFFIILTISKCYYNTNIYPLNEPELSCLKNIKIGQYVAVIYELNIWYGIVEEHLEEFDDFTVNFLHPSASVGISTYHHPSN